MVRERTPNHLCGREAPSTQDLTATVQAYRRGLGGRPRSLRVTRPDLVGREKFLVGAKETGRRGRGKPGRESLCFASHS